VNGRRPAIVAVAVILCAGPAALVAQSDRATIEGLVTDSALAPIPGATVLIVRRETNDEIQISTNESGRYFVPNLPGGSYRVIAAKEGFQRSQYERILAQSMGAVRADFQLAPEVLSTHVEVRSDAAMLDHSTPTVGTQLTARQIHDAPLIVVGRKRDITAYLQFLPGVTNSSTWSPRVNGSSPGNSEVFLDGAPASQNNARGSIQETGPAVEQVGEFAIVTNTFSADYGRTGSWFTNVTIRSGTNELHGSLFDYLNNDALNARSFFQRSRTRLRQDEGGLTLGGPVYLPRVYSGRNRTFFFFGQQGAFWNQTGTGTLLTAPRADFRAGDFSRLLDSSGALAPVFDPASTGAYGARQQFPGNRIPASRISPVSAKIAAMIPAPDLPDQQASNFYSRTGGGSYRNFVSTLKLDHSISQSHKVAITYSDQYNPRVIAGQGWGPTSPLEGSQSPKSIHNRTGRLNYDYIVRGNLLNHFTAGVDRYRNQTRQVSQFQNWNAALGIQGIQGDQGAFPVVAFNGGAASPRGLGGPDFSTNASGRITVADTLTWVARRHSIKIGGNFWPEYANAREGYLSSGSFTFSNLTTSQPNSARYTAWGSSFASFLLGDLSAAAVAEPYTRGARFRSGGAFVQDEWRATARWTLSYGLRWEWNSAPFEPNGNASGFDPSTPNPAASGRPGALVFAGTGPGRTGSRSLSTGWYRGIGPRLGAAFAPTSRTVVRASFGLYYAPGFRTRLIAYGLNNSYTVNSANGYDPAYNWADPFPQRYPRAPFIDPSYQNDQSVSSILPGTSRMPQIATWTVSLQRAISPNLAVEAAYIGSHSTHLILGSQQSNLNTLDAQYLALGSALFQDAAATPYPAFAKQKNRTVGQALRPYPQYLDVTEEWGPHGIARFHSLQVKATKRYSSGLTMLAFYTWSKNMTNVEGGPIDLGPSDGAIQYPRNRAGEVSVSADGPAHVFVTSATYELPFGRAAGGLAARIVAGWRVTGYCRYADGLPLTITSGNPLVAFGFPAIRADYVGGPPLVGIDRGSFDPGRDLYLNTAAFHAPSTFALGNTARVLDWARGFSQKSEAISIEKTIPARDRVQAAFRADVQNPFNFVRWSNPTTSVTSSQFGKVTGAAAGRTIQLGLSLTF
jgi:hypothetical protein